MNIIATLYAVMDKRPAGAFPHYGITAGGLYLLGPVALRG